MTDNSCHRNIERMYFFFNLQPYLLSLINAFHDPLEYTMCRGTLNLVCELIYQLHCYKRDFYMYIILDSRCSIFEEEHKASVT